MRKILITNDDGIESDGIKRLVAVARKFGEVWVIAPSKQCSAASHSITLRNAIDVYPYDFPVDGVYAFAVNGTPGDCVRVGVHGIMKEKPDVVFSGINYGYNAGTDVQYSATVGAAMEGIFQGIHSFAFSEGVNESHAVTNEYLEIIMDEVLKMEHKDGCIINVNFPGCELEDYKGIKRDCMTSRGCVFRDSYIPTEIPGGVSYMVKGEYNEDYELNSDLRALCDNFISIGYVRNIGC